MAARSGFEAAQDDYAAAEKPKRHYSHPLSQSGDEAIDAEDGEHTREVVAERHKAPLTPDLVEAAHEEVAVSGAAFGGEENALQRGRRISGLGTTRTGVALLVATAVRGEAGLRLKSLGSSLYEYAP